MARAGVHDFEVASDAGRSVEQGRRKRVGKPVLSRAVGGNRGLRSTERESLTRAAVVLRLQQEVAIVPHVLAELDSVIARDLSDDTGELNGALRSIPRQ